MGSYHTKNKEKILLPFPLAMEKIPFLCYNRLGYIPISTKHWKILCMVQCTKTKQNDNENRKAVVLTYFLFFASFHHAFLFALQIACMFHGFVATASKPGCSVIQVTACSTSSHFATTAGIS